MKNNITDQLKQLISTELDLNISPEDIDENMSLFEDGIGLDSVAIVELITLVEGHFKFRFSDDELGIEPFKNISTLAHFVTGKLEIQS
ncbi:MAG: acyl carrier protein [SAR324 cluster bacterium]|uniref:Acyl carrier protein n=1 Tax=SAR324 cluster bacterium TaxID=2024889 RepID=A0A2A4T4N4_9DELT|nr:MAG: acyl carrier protein [SAR324 cluster bacterium]